MNKCFILTVFVLVAIGFSGCKKYFEVDSQILQKEVYDPTAIKYNGLEQSTVLYLDHSTCVIEARQNSKIFNALRPQLGQYSDTLVLIKGATFETVPLDRSDNKVFQVLQTIKEDIPYSDIRTAVEQITSGNQQAILITDCEFIEKGRGNNGTDLCHDQDPYLSEPFKRWLQKGHVIYMIVEPYQERWRGNMYDKKRFYFFFTDDRMQAPISDNMLAQLNPLRNSGLFTEFKLTNSDIGVTRDGDMVDDNLDFTYETLPGFDFITINDDWQSIREYVMKLDKYGEPVPEENPVPLVRNFVFNDGNNYVIADVAVKATNITASYLSKDCEAATQIKLDCSEITPTDADMSEGFILDKEALRNRRLNVLLTDKIFNLLTDDYGGNLIRLDFIVTKAGIQNYDSELFSWQSLFSNERAICMALSIDNALRDTDIVPMSKDRRIIHTVFIQTQAYK